MSGIKPVRSVIVRTLPMGSGVAWRRMEVNKKKTHRCDTQRTTTNEDREEHAQTAAESKAHLLCSTLSRED